MFVFSKCKKWQEQLFSCLVKVKKTAAEQSESRVSRVPEELLVGVHYSCVFCTACFVNFVKKSLVKARFPFDFEKTTSPKRFVACFQKNRGILVTVLSAQAATLPAPLCWAEAFFLVSRRSYSIHCCVTHRFAKNPRSRGCARKKSLPEFASKCEFHVRCWVKFYQICTRVCWRLVGLVGRKAVSLRPHTVQCHVHWAQLYATRKKSAICQRLLNLPPQSTRVLQTTCVLQTAVVSKAEAFLLFLVDRTVFANLQKTPDSGGLFKKELATWNLHQNLSYQVKFHRIWSPACWTSSGFVS